MNMTNKSAIGLGMFSSILLAAGAMYLFDPVSGKRRRSLIRDKMGKWGRKSKRALNKMSKNAYNHAKGYAIESRKAVEGMVSTGESVVQNSAMGKVRQESGRPSL